MGIEGKLLAKFGSYHSKGAAEHAISCIAIGHDFMCAKETAGALRLEKERLKTTGSCRRYGSSRVECWVAMACLQLPSMAITDCSYVVAKQSLFRQVHTRQYHLARLGKAFILTCKPFWYMQ